jgi:ABC-type dipeptide/oligopeptide/nickel transport system ATPase component
MTIKPVAPDISPETGPDVLAVEKLAVTFRTDDGIVQAVRGVNFTVREGQALGIVGESGSGKSVSAMAVMGLLPNNARVRGSIKFRGRELLGLPEAELAEIRGSKIAMIFQDPLASLNPVYTIGFQIAEAVQAHQDVAKQEAWERAVELITILGIPRPEQLANSHPHELSGGMRQRVVIAMAMANKPDLIIADEPTTALDVTIQAQVLEALETARKQTGAALLLITHDLGIIAGHAEQVAVMYAGKVVESGSTEEIFYRPRTPYTHGLLDSLPRLDRPKRERLPSS